MRTPVTPLRVASFVTLTLALVMSPATAFGQLFEVGGMVGVGSPGTEAELWGEEDLRPRSVYASLWPGRRWEARIRLATTRRLPVESVFDDVTTRWDDRSRTLLDGALLYHFGDARVRPYVGLGMGAMWDRMVVSCTPPGCENLLAQQGRIRPGKFVARPDHGLVTFGLHARIGRWVAIRSALTFSNFGGGSLATTDLSIGAGIRF